MAMSPSTERSRSDTNASVNSSHAFREIEEQWDWEWELDQVTIPRASQLTDGCAVGPQLRKGSSVCAVLR